MKHGSAGTSACAAVTLSLLFLICPGTADLDKTSAGKDRPPTLAERLCAAYESLDTVSCEVRRTTTVAKTTARMLSRVLYARDDRIHVENFSPDKRRIISDGKNLYYHEDKADTGYVCPIEGLDKTRLLMLRNVPGTPMEHLTQLKELPETTLPPAAGFAESMGYQSEKVYVVLSCDSEGRLARIEFFKSSEMKEKNAQYDFSAFQEAAGDIWIPCVHKAEVFLPNGEKIVETRRISNLAVNEPISDRMFDAQSFFKDVELVEEASADSTGRAEKR
jgi:hypothetical protein